MIEFNQNREISNENVKEYTRIRGIVKEALFIGFGGSTDTTGKEWVEVAVNISREECQSVIDFFSDLKKYLPTDKDLYGEV